jgi:maleylpyruvate isomerase
VLAHIALNADSLVNLFSWARTGVETPQYPSWEVRNADIDRFSTRSVDEHLDEIRASSQRYVEAALAVPSDRWERSLVAGIGAEPQPAHNYLSARRREVEVHHWDLDTGYGPREWPKEFVEQELERAPARFAQRVEEPFELHDLVSGAVISVGEEAGFRVVGRGPDLLGWLFGRSDGRGLQTSDGRPLPALGEWG